MSYFTEKTIWITGASSGIGRALALAMAAEGARLILSSRKRAQLELVAAECHQANEVIIIPLDLMDHEALDTILLNHTAQLSKVDILINNAGISQRALAKDSNFDVYKKLMDVNYLGTVKISQAVLPHFITKNEGHFVTISSMAGKFGVPLRSGYSASKMALHGYFDALRAELSETEIKVTMVCPGYIRTDISKNALTGSGQAQGTMDEAQLKGMPVDTMAAKVLSAIRNRRAEVHIGGFKEVTMAGLLHRLAPGLLRRIIARTKVT